MTVNINDKLATCAIVVTYNRSKLLSECINQLIKHSDHLVNILIVNNASTDNTKQVANQLATDNSNVTVLELSTNLGGAGGFSHGMRYAMQTTTAKYFWLMDDDSMAQAGCLDHMLAVYESEDDIAFLSPNVRWKDGQPTNVMETTNDWPENVDKGIVKIKHGSFVGFLVSRQAVKLAGLPIEEFFIWNDDTEYSLRLLKQQPGKKGYFVSKAIMLHKSASNQVASGITHDTTTRIPRYFYYYRNKMYIDRMYFNKTVVFKDLVKAHLACLKVLLSRKTSHKFKRILVVNRGLSAGMRFSPKVKMN